MMMQQIKITTSTGQKRIGLSLHVNLRSPVTARDTGAPSKLNSAWTDSIVAHCNWVETLKNPIVAD